MSPQENKKVLEAFVEANNRGDMETSMKLIADDIRWTNMGSTALSGIFEGKAEVGEKLLGPLFSTLKAGIQMQVDLLLAEGDHVVAKMSGIAETLDGRPYNNQYCWIIRIRDGQFAEITEYADTALISSIWN